jgi:hypothetical protein
LDAECADAAEHLGERIDAVGGWHRNRVLEFFGCPVGDDLTAVDDDDAVGQRIGLLQILGRQKHRNTLGPKRSHQAPDVPAAHPE